MHSYFFGQNVLVRWNVQLIIKYLTIIIIVRIYYYLVLNINISILQYNYKNIYNNI